MCNIRLNVFDISSINEEELSTDKFVLISKSEFANYSVSSRNITKSVLTLHGFTNHQYINYFKEEIIYNAREPVGVSISYLDGHGNKLWWIVRRN